jgi:hypothetical protein
MICDRCWRDVSLTYCTGCGNTAHPDERCWDGISYDAVCKPCWAILSHVKGVISCPSGCDCAQYLEGDGF